MTDQSVWSLNRKSGSSVSSATAWSRDEPLRVAFACDVPHLEGIPTAKRDLSAAVQHLAARVEVLIDDDHGRAKVPRPNGGGQPGASCPDDHDIRLVGPSNGLDGRHLRQRGSRRRQNGRAYAGGSSRLDEIPPADGLLALRLSIFGIAVAFLGHVFTSRYLFPSLAPFSTRTATTDWSLSARAASSAVRP